MNLLWKASKRDILDILSLGGENKTKPSYKNKNICVNKFFFSNILGYKWVLNPSNLISYPKHWIFEHIQNRQKKKFNRHSSHAEKMLLLATILPPNMSNIVCKDYEISAKKKQFYTIWEKFTSYKKIRPMLMCLERN